MRLTKVWWLVLALVVSLVVGVAAFGLVAFDPSPTRRAGGADVVADADSGTDVSVDVGVLCAASIELDGATYYSVGGFDRVPALTGRELKASTPSCPKPDEQLAHSSTTVHEIEGVPTEVAVWDGSDVAVREGAALPAWTDAWSRPPRCRSDGDLTLVGQWSGVRSKLRPRFDGDLRPPQRVTLYVERAVPDRPDLERWTLSVRDVGTASPRLGRRMAREALWSSRSLLRVGVRCEGGRYVATSFALAPHRR